MRVHEKLLKIRSSKIKVISIFSRAKRPALPRGRPPRGLFPLFAELTALDGVGPKTARLFGRLEIAHPRT